MDDEEEFDLNLDVEDNIPNISKPEDCKNPRDWDGEEYEDDD